MKTVLPAQLTTVSEVENFISELWTNDEFFHLDDDANDIVNTITKEPLFTKEEADKINSLLEQAFSICEVWDLHIVEKILEEAQK